VSKFIERHLNKVKQAYKEVGLKMKIMNNNETTKVLGLIEELKSAKNQKEIEKIVEAREDIIWSEVEGFAQDDWNEALGDAKKGLYF